MKSLRVAVALAAGLAMMGASRPGPSRRAPKLTVVIVVDQMPAGDLDRWDSLFGEQGFRRLRREGRSFSGARYLHATNLTGPGHSVIGTGDYGNLTGIVGNHWVDRKTGRDVNSAIGPWKPGETGRCSVASWADLGPGAARVPNPCNQLGLSLAERVKKTYPKARVVGVALKDRSAILTVGKGADAAYWLESKQDESGAFVCSGFYPSCSAQALDFSREEGLGETLPDPAQMSLFRRHPQWRCWECSLSAPCEQHCPQDVAAAHLEDYGLGPGFPHPVSSATALLYTPAGNDLLEAMAERVVQAHGLGKNPSGQPDLLMVGFSSTDYFGHLYGPDSCESADGFKRLDATLAKLLDFLVARVGRGNLLVVLTADHGVTPIPQIALRRGEPAGRLDMSDRARFPRKVIGELPPLRQRIEYELGRMLGIKLDASTPLADALIRGYREPSLYLNGNRIGAASVPLARAWLADYLMHVEGVQEVHSFEDLSQGDGPSSALLSFHPDRSGDLMVFLKPGWIEWDSDAGTSHGQPHDAEARVPLLIWGAGVDPGKEAAPVDMARVAATLCEVLKLETSGLADPLSLPLRGSRSR